MSFLRNSFPVIAALSLFVLTPSVTEGKDKSGAEHLAKKITEAGVDYQVQGEYVGEMETYGETTAVGLQVIAKGKGNFEATGYEGGLPGAGWDGETKAYFKGRTEGGKTVLESTESSSQEIGESLSVVIGAKGENAKVLDGSGEVLGKLKKTLRKSPTLLKKAPEGAVVLFNATTTEHFKTKRGQPVKMTPDGLLILERRSGGLETTKQFQSCKLHLEFLLPFEPTHGGQGRANSGCYLQGRYEVQILDSFGLKGTESECGGMYSSRVNPKVNMCLPPLTWQTFDIDFTAAKFDGNKKIAPAKMTVHHNGVLVYKDQVIGHTTTASPIRTETPDAKYHYLQDHGHDLWFRNIWVLEK